LVIFADSLFDILNLFVECWLQCRIVAGFFLMRFLIMYTLMYTPIFDIQVFAMPKLTDMQIRAWIKAGDRFDGKADGNGLY
ncbi:hypothetical protein ACSLN1_26375, partial [Escherichia coli]